VGHTLPVQALTFSPDGATLTTAAYHCAATATEVEVTDWDVATGQPTVQRAAPLTALRGLDFAPGGRMLAAAGEDRGIWLWETIGSHERRRLGEHGTLVGALAFSRDGSQLVTADFADVVMLWEVVGGRARACWKANTQGVVSLAFAPGGIVLGGGGSDNTIRLWDAATGEERGVLVGHACPVLALAFACDGRTLATGDCHGVVRLWDVAALRERTTLVASQDKVVFEDVTAVTFAPDGGTLAVAIGPAVQLWDVASGHHVARLEGHTGNVRCLAFSPDGGLLASGGHDRTVRLWDLARHRAMNPGPRP
jgi:WD40 repeat protein